MDKEAMRDKSGKRNLLLTAAIVSLSIPASMNIAYADDLWDAINNAASSGYTLSGDYSLPDGKSSLGELQSLNFTLEGNNHKVLLNNKPGIFIDDDHTMTIQNAVIENAQKSDEDGSAISNDGTLTITNSKFINNRTSVGMGGAIYNDGKITSLYADFNNNYTNNARGGAIYNNDEIGTINGKFVENKTNSSNGGAIYNNGTITSIIADFMNNSSGFYGGAIYNYNTIGSISGDFTGNSANSEGGAIYNSSGGKITSISGNFTDNIAKEYESGSTGKLYGEGAAINNDGIITSINANFTSNKAEGSNSRGGAIYNKGTITSISGDFEGNSANQEGGAIWYEHANASGGNGKIETINSNFISNTAGTKGGAIYIKQEINSITGNFTSNTAGKEGGAIYNNNDKIGSITGDFIKNTAGTKGGAIYNTDDDITSISGNFNSNSANSDGGAIWNGGNSTRGIISTITGDFTNNSSGGNGGAIYNNDGLGTITGDFTNNSAKGQGGAVWNDDTINQITGNFAGNSSKDNGGAVYNDDTITITGSFTNNYIIGNYKGGAIYNDCNLYIVTDDTHDITFSGNMQNVTSITRDTYGNITSVVGGESNAIFNNDYVEFNVKHGRAIRMYDKLTDVDNYNWEWVKTGGGTLALGEDMSGIVGDVWIKEGIVKLVQNNRDLSVYGTGFSNADDVTYENNVYIDSQNDHIDNFHLGNDVTLEGTLHALIDVNLADEPTADKIIAGNDVDSGSIVIESIIIITGGGSFETPRNVLIADEHTRERISLGSGITISGEGKTNWTLGYTPTTGMLNFSGDVTLKEVANAATPATRIFSAAENEILAENIGNISNDNANLTINMNNHAINGQNHSGFVTTAGTQKLTVNDANVGNFHNGTGNVSFIYDNNGAEININNSTFMNNEAANGGVIYSSGKLTLTDSSFINNKISGYGGAIYSKGDVTVNAINKDVEFAGNYDESNLITNAIYMAGTEENPVTLTLNSKISENEVSIDDKLDGSYYNIVINSADDSVGDVVFYNNVNTGSLTLNKGLLENNGIVTVTSGTNNGTITCDNTLSDVKGDFILNDDDSATRLVFDNNGSFTQNSLTIESGEFKTNANNIHITDIIVNKDILNLEGGNLASSVSGAGTTKIAGDVGFANTATAISQAVNIEPTGKLTADTANLTGTSVTNDGTLKFNNSANGLIGQNISGSTASSSGIVEIAAADNIKVGLNGKSITDNSVKLTSGIFDVTANANASGDIDISSMGLIANGGKLSIKDDKTGTITLGNVDTAAGNLNLSIDLNLVNQEADKLTQKTGTSISGGNKINLKEITLTSDAGTATPDNMMIADTTIAASNLDLGQTTISGAHIGNLLLTLTSDTEGSYLHTEHSDLENAITSSITTKMYSMGDSEPTIDNLILGGTSLSITTNGKNIVSTSNAKSTDGIKITNSGQTLSITGTLDSSGNPETTISGFKTAIDNSASGEVNLTNIKLNGNSTDVLNAGNLNLEGKNSIDTIADNATPAGTTTVNGGTSTIGSLVQKAVKILSGGIVNIDADKLSTTEGTNNQGTLNLSGGNLASNINDSQATKTGTTNIKGDVTNTSDKTISQKSVTIDSSSSLTTSADKVTTDDGISNAGKLNLTGGNLASDVTGAGTTNISGDVGTNGNNITQTDVNIGQNSSGTAIAGKLTNNDTINATNVNVTTAGTLDNNGTISATSIANAGTASFKTGSDVDATDITTSANATTNFTGGYVDAANITNNGGTNNFDGATIGATNIGKITNNGGNTNVLSGSITTVTIDNKAGDTSISGGSIIVNAINNTSTTAGDDISISGGTVVTDTINNSGAGATAISGGNITANTSITNSGSGSTDISSAVMTPSIVASNGTVNINAINGQTATSNLLKDTAGTGAANITTALGAEVNINTNSSAIVIDNNVLGAGTLTLKGNAGTAQSSSNVGTEFYVNPNAVVSSAINLAAGQLNTGDASNITGAISVAADATLNTMNGGYSIFNNTTFADGAQLKVDVNAMSNKADNFMSVNEPTSGYEYLTDLSIQDLSKIVQNSKSINLSQSIGLNNLQSTDDLVANLNAKYTKVLTPIRKMNANVQMTPEGLMLNIAGTGNKYKDFNPAVMASTVAAQMGGYLTQLNSYDEAFRNMDMYMLMTASQRQALKYKNKIASLDGGVLYDKTLMRQERAEGWFRPYATFEKVGLKNGPKVENQAYGTFVGGESEMYDLGHGWDGMWGAYVGYNGSHQHYDGVNIYQNGGTIGAVGMVYKGNFFTGLTINAGASAAEAHTMYGHEDITMLMAGIASKTGYNLELANGKFIIQPSWLMSYSFVNTFDYTNAAGVRMHSSPLNAIQLQPELKFIGNLKNGWQPYASVAMIWNIMDDTKFKANDVTLPELSVKPFVKYGVGLRKTWGERFTGFFQTYLTNGGRNGVGLQAGFTWTIGGQKDQKTDEQKYQKPLKKHRN